MIYRLCRDNLGWWVVGSGTLLGMFLLIMTVVARAEGFPVTLRVRPSSAVTGGVVTIGDVGIVESAGQGSDDRAVSLKQVVLVDHLDPGSERQLHAHQILDRLRTQSFEPSTLGYSIPEQVVVRRVGRDLTQGELQESIDEYLRGTGREVVVRRFSLDGTARLFAGAASLRVISLERQRVGVSRILLEARSESGETARLGVVGQLDEFMYVPVASKQLPPGNVVRTDDVVMARMDMSKMPRDAAAQPDGVVGHAVKRGVAAGDPFRFPDLALPQDVAAGAFVVVRYIGRGFAATATGTALDAGRVGTTIRVRNDSSKRVIQGTIVEAGLVEVH